VQDDVFLLQARRSPQSGRDACFTRLHQQQVAYHACGFAGSQHSQHVMQTETGTFFTTYLFSTAYDTIKNNNKIVKYIT
jgi:hypothetical protein